MNEMEFDESRYLSFKRAGCRTCTGNETDVLRAQASPDLVMSALIIRIVLSEHQVVETEGAMWIVVWEYSLRFLAQISILQP